MTYAESLAAAVANHDVEKLAALTAQLVGALYTAWVALKGLAAAFKGTKAALSRRRERKATEVDKYIRAVVASEQLRLRRLEASRATVEPPRLRRPEQAEECTVDFDAEGNGHSRLAEEDDCV